MPIDKRKNKVLQTIILDYISTGEPVGSRTLARKYNFGVSPATLRNEMADLEDMGYLEQPHTSAGRVPSDKGYRFYVDCIMEKHRLSEIEEKYIKFHFEKKMGEIESVIDKTTDLLSELTQYTALVMGPNLENNKFKYMQMSIIEEGKALLVLITDTGLIHNKILEIPSSITNKDLARISMVLNSRLKGIAFESVKKSVLDDIFTELLAEKLFVKVILDIIEATLSSDASEKVFLGGALNILNQPEFKDIEKIKTILGMLEEKEILKELMRRDNKTKGLDIKIGEENKYEGIRECSLITANYHINGEVVGTIGILGPTRMKYSKTVALVEYITNVLSSVLSNKK